MSQLLPPSHRNRARIGLLLAASMSLAACGVQVSQHAADQATKAVQQAAVLPVPVARATASAATKAASVQNPILFVTQVPISANGSADPFASRMSTFANHLPDIGSVPRGGDLMIRYPDGSLRNLTREAGFGMDGLQGANAIAVREPTVHWSGTKAVFSMVVGAPPRQYQSVDAKWQLYEVTGLARGERARITPVANQPTAYNNVSPLYASDDRILFTSDRPRSGQTHLYPQLDEYESTPTITGIYSLDPATGALRILNHTPSGAFSPSIDSYGRVIFTRWDHLQRDQQGLDAFGAFDYVSEAAGALRASQRVETFPESRTGMASASYGQVAGFTYNLFTPWQMNQDGTDELTLNHIGRHELTFNHVPRSFVADRALADAVGGNLRANRTEIEADKGLFHLREDPRSPGTLLGVYANEFEEGTSGRIMRVSAAPTLSANQMTITPASALDGRYRNPLPTSSGAVVASHTASATFVAGIELRLHALEADGSGLLAAGAPLTDGIRKTVSWWTPDFQTSYSGLLWEIDPAEVVARTPPPGRTLALTAPEREVLAEEEVSEASLREWMQARDLALVVVRNQTSRDQADRQQPYNLQVPGGTKTVNGTGRLYEISHFQVFQGNQVRAYDGLQRGRRVLAQPSTVSENPVNAAGPAGSVTIARDGSSAAFVPASRALTWQTTDPAGEAIVRERIWVTLQPGEIRTCSGCHGENTRNQAGAAPSQAKPEALRALIRHWKQNQPATPTRRNGSAPLTQGS